MLNAVETTVAVEIMYSAFYWMISIVPKYGLILIVDEP